MCLNHVLFQPRLIPALFLFIGTVFCSPAQAQLFHGAAIFKTPVGPDGSSRAHVGDTITATLTVVNLDDFLDTSTITNLLDVVHHASGDVTSTNLLASPVTLDSYLAGGIDTIELTHRYVVLPGDENLPESLLFDDAEAGGLDNHDGLGGTGMRQAFFVSFPGQIFVLRPGLKVSQTCLGVSGEAGLVSFTGSISNSGNTVLTGVVVSNLVDGAFVYVLGPTNLGTNEIDRVITFTGSYRLINPCHSSPNTLFAWGADELGLEVMDSATVTCPVAGTLAITCPSNVTVQSLADVPPADPGAVTVASSFGSVTVVSLGDSLITNGYEFVIMRTYRATDGCSNVAFCTQTITAPAPPPFLVVQPPRFNPQTGLFEEVVRILNPSPFTLSAVQVAVSNLTAGVQVFNASGTNHGIPFAQFNQPIPPGASADLTIEYYSPRYQTPDPALSVALVGSPAPMAPVNVTVVPVTRQLWLSNGEFLLEFNSLAGRIYFVEYSADLRNWKVAWPGVTGTGNRIQWIDNGPPRTDSKTSTQASRFYRVVLVP